MTRWLVLLLSLVCFAGSALATEHEVTGARGAVYVDGTVRWRGKSVTSAPVWSERGDALAFAGRDREGNARLGVVLVDDALEPVEFSWPVPRAARPATAVSWLGEGRVGAGPSKLHPRMVVAFSLD